MRGSSHAKIFYLHTASVLGSQIWTASSAANQELAAIMEVSDTSKDWIESLLSRMRRNQAPVALPEMQEFAGGAPLYYPRTSCGG